VYEMYRVSLKFCITGQSISDAHNLISMSTVHCDGQCFIFLKNMADDCRADMMTCVGDFLLEMCNTADLPSVYIISFGWCWRYKPVWVGSGLLGIWTHSVVSSAQRIGCLVSLLWGCNVLEHHHAKTVLDNLFWIWQAGKWFLLEHLQIAVCCDTVIEEGEYVQTLCNPV